MSIPWVWKVMVIWFQLGSVWGSGQPTRSTSMSGTPAMRRRRTATPARLVMAPAIRRSTPMVMSPRWPGRWPRPSS